MSNCGKCFKSVNRSSKDKVRCEICKTYYHLECAKISQSDDASVWRCEKCPKERRLSRALSDSSSTSTSNIMNVENMKSLLTNLEGKIVSGQRQLEQDLGKSLNLCHEKLDENSNLLRSQQEVIAKQTELIELLRLDNLALKKRVNELEIKLDSCDQYSRSNTLEIYGIPELKNENTPQIVVDVCKALDVDIKEEALDICHRLKKQNNRPTSGIIVRFVRRFDKERVLQQRRIKRNFSTRHLGYSDASDTPIYLNQSLTRNRRLLFAKARRIKQEKNIQFLWVDKAGNIKMRKEEGSKVFIIQCDNDLQTIVDGT
jgi:hypothetical protein